MRNTGVAELGCEIVELLCFLLELVSLFFEVAYFELELAVLVFGLLVLFAEGFEFAEEIVDVAAAALFLDVVEELGLAPQVFELLLDILEGLAAEGSLLGLQLLFEIAEGLAPVGVVVAELVFEAAELVLEVSDDGDEFLVVEGE